MLKIIIPLVVGALIGYVTNNLAIKMLFHPRQAHYIGKFQIPFTPGLIPKEKKRIAKSLGKAVSTQLLSSEILLESLTSDEMTNKIRASITNLIMQNQDNEATVEELLEKLVSEEKLEGGVDRIRQSLSTLIKTKLQEMDFKESIASSTGKSIREYMENLPFWLRQLIEDQLIDKISQGIGEVGDYIIKEQAPEVVDDLLEKEIDKLMETRVCDLLAGIKDKVPAYLDMGIEVYRKVMNDSLEGIMEKIDLGGMVEERVDSFDVVQLEDLIFGIMKKELNAIVYLGALLGFLMGFVNIILNMLL